MPNKKAEVGNWYKSTTLKSFGARVEDAAIRKR